MSKDDRVIYDLRLKPLRFGPDLAESIMYGLKWSLVAVFEDPFPVRDILLAVRELIDNVIHHADWNRAPAPALFVRCRVEEGCPALRISSLNVAKDVDEAQRAVDFLHAYVSKASSGVLSDQLTAQLIHSACLQTSGGIGLLQVASSPRCQLDVRLEGALFCAEAKFDLPESKASRLCSRESPLS